MDARIPRGWREGVIRDCLTNPFSSRDVFAFSTRQGQRDPIVRSLESAGVRLWVMAKASRAGGSPRIDARQALRRRSKRDAHPQGGRAGAPAPGACFCSQVHVPERPGGPDVMLRVWAFTLPKKEGRPGGRPLYPKPWPTQAGPPRRYDTSGDLRHRELEASLILPSVEIHPTIKPASTLRMRYHCVNCHGCKDFDFPAKGMLRHRVQAGVSRLLLGGSADEEQKERRALLFCTLFIAAQPGRAL